MNEVLSFVIGLLVRLGIPIGISALLFALLRRLDKEWQSKANLAPVMAVGQKPCWEVKNCPEKKRKTCPAANQPHIPCWQTFRSADGLLRSCCLECSVFRQTKSPTPA